MSSVPLITPTDAEKLWDFQPIEWGFLKFLAGFIVTLVLMANVVLVVHFSGPYVQDPLLRALGLFAAAAFLSVIFIYVLSGARGEWIKSYFARDVRGYLVRVLAPVDPKLPRWYADVVTSHAASMNVPSFEMRGLITIELRLGGWISFGGTGIFESGKPIDQNHLLRNWRVSLHRVLHTGAVLVRVEYTHPDSDGKHERVVLEVADAIRLLAFVNQRNNSVVSISDALTEYRRCLESAEIEAERVWNLDKHSQAALTEAQDALERVKGERDAAQSAAELNNVEVTRLADQLAECQKRFGASEAEIGEFVRSLTRLHEQIERTDRLKDTIEGLELHAAVLTGLILHFQNRDEKVPLNHWHDKRAVVEANLTAKRKNQRKRSRAAGTKQSAV